jgi:mannosyltransferase
MMSLLIDGIIFSLQRHGGISVYFRQLIERIRRDSMRAEVTFDGALQQDISFAEGDELSLVMRTPRVAERYRRCRITSTTNASVFHSTYYRRPDHRAIPTVVTVYDFTYERCDSGLRRFVHSAQKFAAIREAQAIVCISQSTLDDLQELVGVRPGQQTHVIHLGVSEEFRPIETAPAKRPFMLFVGQRGGYKNFRLAVEALQLLPHLELWCVGGGGLMPSELSGVPEDIRSRVVHVGFVSDSALNELYNRAVCLVYPSSYEGFGIPVVEAMRSGCPVVSTRCKAILEVGLDALTVAESTSADLARCVQQTLDPKYRLGQVNRGFAVAERYSWERCYQETVQVYSQFK